MPVEYGNFTKSRHARLFASLGLSLVLHTAILQITPEGGQWMRGEPIPAAVSMTVYLSPNADQSGAPPQSVAIPMAQDNGASASTLGEHNIPQPALSPAPQASATTSVSKTPGPTGMFPGPWYYPARYLHRRPTPLKPIWPAYPEELATISGRVIILLLINDAGAVDQYRIESSEPPGVFDASVIAAFTAAQYAPALITGYRVKSQLIAEVSFEPGAPPRADFSIMEPIRPIQDAGKSLGKEN